MINKCNRAAGMKVTITCRLTSKTVLLATVSPLSLLTVHSIIFSVPLPYLSNLLHLSFLTVWCSKHEGCVGGDAGGTQQVQTNERRATASARHQKPQQQVRQHLSEASEKQVQVGVGTENINKRMAALEELEKTGIN